MRKNARRLLALLLALLLLPLPPAARAEGEATGLRVAELMYKNRATLRDEDGDFSDWVELENGGSRPVELAGWTLSDRSDRPGWALPDRRLQPGERLLLFADAKDRREGELHTDFALNKGETLLLRAPDGTLASEVLCSEVQDDASLLRTDEGYVECLYPTPCYYDTAAGYNAWQESCKPLGALQINEACVYERKARFGEYYGECDWVELKNISGDYLSLAGWALADSSRRYALPALTLEPDELLLLRCADGESDPQNSHDYCTGFALNAGGEQLYLYEPSGALVDWAALRGIPLDTSFGRDPARGGWCFFAKPTPGHANSGGVRRVSATPVSSTRDGVFEGVKSVSISLEAAGEIRYTLNGSLPNRDSKVYTGPITLSETDVLRAVAYERDALPSSALSQSFFLNEGHTLPIASLMTDSPSEYRTLYNNPDYGMRLVSNIAWYDDAEGFNLPCELRLNGESSVVLSKKNYRLRFRDAYGAGDLEYDCFGGGVTHFKTLLLRSGQNYAAAVMKNELGCAMAAAASNHIFVQRFRYCVLYINGEYAGIYALMEKTNEQMAADLMGVSRESVTTVEADASRHSVFYEEVLEPAFSLDLSEAENYRLIAERLDLDSLIDWVILEGWCGNLDLQSGNLRYVRSTENDGKWRLMLYDLDSTFASAENCFDLLSPPSLENRQIGRLLSALLRNADFRDRLLRRAAELFAGPLRDEALLAEIDSLEAILAPEIPRNHALLDLDPARWAKNVNRLRALCDGQGWVMSCVDALCYYLNVSQEERDFYFGGLG